MDVSKFKATRARLIAWIVIPPLLCASIGLSTYALQRRSHWELKRTEMLSGVLPKIFQAQAQAGALLSQFQGMGNDAIRSEDQMIAFLQESAQRTGFIYDSVKVERRMLSDDQKMPLLSATMRGFGSYGQIERFLGEVASEQLLLSVGSVKLSQSKSESIMYDSGSFQAELVFELLLFDGMDTVGGSVQ